MSSRRSPEKRGGDLSRRTEFRRQKPRILVVCEGKVTEDQYFNRLAAFFKASSVDVTSCDVEGIGQDPVSVVKHALDKRDRAAQKKGEGYSQVWCVVDVDQHPNLEDAILLAKRNNVRLAISNMCFEIWVLWHFQDHNSYATKDQLVEKIRVHIKNYVKDLPPVFPFGAHEDAKARALRAGSATVGARTNNPGSTVWAVVDAIKRARTPTVRATTPRNITNRHDSKRRN